MKKIKTREEFLNEQRFNSLSEDAMIDIDIMLDDLPEPVLRSLSDMGIKNADVQDFGVIKASVEKRQIEGIKNLDGVEGVEVAESHGSIGYSGVAGVAGVAGVNGISGNIDEGFFGFGSIQPK